MASLKVVMDTRCPDIREECPILIKILHEGERKLIDLYQRAKPEYWDSRKSRLKERTRFSEQRLKNARTNFFIESSLIKIKKIILDLEFEGRPYCMNDIIKSYYKSSAHVSFYNYTEGLIESMEKIGKKGNSLVYKYTLNRLMKYGKKEWLTFQEINYTFLTNFEMQLVKDGCKLNTISLYLRTLRSIFNRAIKDGVLGEEHYPFRKISIKTEKTTKRAIYKEDIANIKKCDLNFYPNMGLARDVFMFSFYMRGMSFKDIAYLKVKNIIDDRIYYARQKTSQKLNVKLVENAKTIILKYNDLRDPDSYIFPLIKYPGVNEYHQYKNSYRNVNRLLKSLGTQLKIEIPLTTYVARHSWASIAKRCGIPVSVISEGLGHDSEKTTQIYLDSFENSILDSANEMITDI